MFTAPAQVAGRLYAAGSLDVDGDGFRFTLHNRLSDATLTRIFSVRVDDAEVPLDALSVELDDGRGAMPASSVTPARPAVLALSGRATVRARGVRLATGAHDLVIAVEAAPFGAVELRASDLIAPPDGAAPWPGDAPATERQALADAMAAHAPAHAPIHAPAGAPAGAAAAVPHVPGDPPALGDVPEAVPYDKDPARDHRHDAVVARQRYVERHTGVRPVHLGHLSFDPAITAHNIERLVGVAQVPVGLAGPLRILGEHARGDFLVPLATTEGTLVASYSRGMKALNRAGGVTCTVAADCMQRAPVFVFDSARQARDFVAWVEAHLPEIRAAAEATSRVARLLYIEPYLASRFAFLRFDYSTGDAAGQNMVGKATYAACDWILRNARGVRRWYLESNFATDKKVSHVNVMRTRGKRVTAEVTMPRAVLREVLHVEPEQLHAHAEVANVGAFLSGATNNGLHAANAITALFIATGQDVANVTEGSAAVVYSEVQPDGSLYLSITIPSLIVATHGGGTGLATQRECLEILGCAGPGTVDKLAEIVAGTVLAGELSLAAAISALEWVPAHERLGRNR